MALSHVSMEDVYLTVLNVDGHEWSQKLRERMRDPSADDGGNSTGGPV